VPTAQIPCPKSDGVNGLASVRGLEIYPRSKYPANSQLLLRSDYSSFGRTQADGLMDNPHVRKAYLGI